MENRVRAGLIRNEKKEIRIFAAGVFAVCQVIAIVSFWKEGSVYLYFSGFGFIFGFAGLFFPWLLAPFYRKWMTVASTIGRFQTKLLLSIVFYAIITPIALFFRIIRKDLLGVKTKPNIISYWKKRHPMQDGEC